MVRPEAAAAVAVAEQEQALGPALGQEQEQEQAQEPARELVAVTSSSLVPRSFDSRYHRNP